MSSIQASLGVDIFDFISVEALAKSCLGPQAFAFGLVQPLHVEGFPLDESDLDGLVLADRCLGDGWSSDQISLIEKTVDITCSWQIPYELSPKLMQKNRLQEQRLSGHLLFRAQIAASFMRRRLGTIFLAKVTL
jgi:hypothetical protein